EVQSHLYVAVDQKYISEVEFHEVYNNAEEISRMIQSFSNYLKNSKPPPNSTTPKPINSKRYEKLGNKSKVEEIRKEMEEL
ncbi:MAG: four helix bundle protein, partial [Thermoplasmatales archaeon]|nr:four helix bundle protein [Thermoplasmatales archaeon]